MKVMITGITGFVGSSLAHALAKEGVQLFGLIRPSSDLSRLANLNVTCIESNVLVPSSLFGVFDWVDVVIHVAGRMPEFGVSEMAYHQLHVDGTNHVLAEIDRLDGPPKVLYISDACVLGPTNGKLLTETAELNPQNAYARSKASAEALVQIYAQNGLPVTMVRPSFIYGPQDTHFLRMFQAVQNGRFWTVDSGQRKFQPTFIGDAVDGMLRVLQNGRAGEIYHIAGAKTVTFAEFGNTIAKGLHVKMDAKNVSRSVAKLRAFGMEIMGNIFKKTPSLNRDEVTFYSQDHCYSWQKAQKELDYSPNISLESGIAKTVQWYQQQGLLQAPVLSS